MDQSLRYFFTHSIVVSSFFGVVPHLGFAYAEMQTPIIEQRGFYIGTAEIQTQANTANQADPPAVTTAEVGGATVAHEFCHMVIMPSGAVAANFWNGNEHRINIDGAVPALMASATTKQTLRESSVRIELITQSEINLANNPALK